MKLRQLLLLIPFVVMLSGCAVFREYYPSVAYSTSLSPGDKLNFRCSVDESDGFFPSHRTLRFEVWFDEDAKPEKIKDIKINFIRDNGPLTLNEVFLDAERREGVTDAQTAQWYYKKRFTDLPEDERLTVLPKLKKYRGFTKPKVVYRFEYLSRKNINDQTLEVNVRVDLENGRRIDAKAKLYLQVSHGRLICVSQLPGKELYVINNKPCRAIAII